MKTDLDHLPEGKREDLARILEIIFAEFEDVLALATQNWKKQGRIMKVILYGSHARGDWIADPVGRYYSDYDILVIVNDERLADKFEYWGRAEDHLVREHAIAKRISAEVSLAVHSMNDVNFQLSRGRPFFVDVVREGIALYELGDHPFTTPKPLEAPMIRDEAEVHFKQWFESAEEFLGLAKMARQKGWEKRAAFLLHQATEHAYHTVLLVTKLYSPKSHNIKFLRAQAEDAARDLIPIWSRDSKFTRRCFQLLQEAYVKARYSPHFKVRDEELEWLVERVEALHAEVRVIAESRIAPAIH